MNKGIIALLLIISLAVNCSSFEEPEFFSILNVEEVSLDVVTDNQIRMTASGVAAPCESIDEAEIILRESSSNAEIITYQITLARLNPTLCDTPNDNNGGSGLGVDVLLVPISASVTFQFDESTTYLFRFIRPDNSFFEFTVDTGN